MITNYLNLEYFLIVARSENMTKAAQELFLSQSALSKAMKTLEEDLGVTLFKKNGRGIILSRYGKILYDRLNVSFQSIESAISDIRDMQGNTEGTVNISSTSMLGISYVPKAIREFAKSYPKVMVHLQEKSSMFVIDDILSGSADIGLCVDFTEIRKDDEKMLQGELFQGHDLSDIEYTRILTEDMCLLCHPDNEYSSKKIIVENDLTEAKLMLYNHYTATRQVLHRIGLAAGMSGMIHDCLYRVANEATIVSMVRENLGVGIIPNISCLDTSGLVRIPIVRPHEYRHSYMIWNKRCHSEPIVDIFRANIIQNKCKIEKEIIGEDDLIYSRVE